jgi:hypothetical protein
MYQPNPEQRVLTAGSDLSQEPYQAPLRYSDGSLGGVVKGEYIVELSPGYSFEDHCRNIGRDMDGYEVKVLKHVFLDSIGYSCTGVNDEILDKIRADTSVKEVFCVPQKGPSSERPART